jgi:hypothetical protein
VRFANALAKLGGVYAGEFDAAEVGSLVLVGSKHFSLSERDIDALTNGLRQRVDERMA